MMQATDAIPHSKTWQ